MLPSNNLTQSIVHSLGVAIVTGTYSEQNPFPVEAVLCEQFNASRNVLREAVKMLTAKGLLSARPRQGTKVEPEENWNLFDPDVLTWMLERRFSLQLLSEFTEIRYSIEPMAAWLAARKGNNERIGLIAKALERMEAADKGQDDPLQSDIAFHLSILNASENRFYAQFRGLVGSALTISIRFTNRFKGVKLASIDDHRKIYNAIIKGDPDEAKQAMELLLGEVQGLIKEAMIKEEAGAKRPLTPAER